MRVRVRVSSPLEFGSHWVCFLCCIFVLSESSSLIDLIVFFFSAFMSSIYSGTRDGDTALHQASAFSKKKEKPFA